jgi:hypothetical protein
LKSKTPTLQVRQGRNIYIAEKNKIEGRALAHSVVYVGPSLSIVMYLIVRHDKPEARDGTKGKAT